MMGKSADAPKTVTSLRMPTALLERIRILAALEDRPIGAQMIRLMRMGLEQQEQQGSSIRRLA
jgi:hypothetical protein